jgi:aminoglycoside phosphotransferase (APT) family kinase protein
VARGLTRLHELTRYWSQRPGFRSTRELLAEDAGGDVHLDLMPEDSVARVREAWAAIADEPTSVVHGDPGASNIRIRDGRAGLLDWDEARVDASALDLAYLPVDLAGELGMERLARARRAAGAWEAANSWLLEPEYARRRLARLEEATAPDCAAGRGEDEHPSSD